MMIVYIVVLSITITVIMTITIVTMIVTIIMITAILLSCLLWTFLTLDYYVTIHRFSIINSSKTKPAGRCSEDHLGVSINGGTPK